MKNATNKNSITTLNISLILITISLISCQNVDQNFYSADVIIYGGTSSAVIAAVELAQSGKSVIMVSPDVHLGGLTSGGLGWTDAGKKEAIGGLTREFYHHVWKYYDNAGSWKWQQKSEFGNRAQGNPAIDGNKRTLWAFEPHVAEDIFEEYISENKIEIYRDEWLNRENGVLKSGSDIISITTLSGKTFKGKVFIDATYEGDLMASAKVSYHVGRESNATYNENWNGVQTGILHHMHYFKSDISPYKISGDPASGVLPRISEEHPGEYGAADDKIQAYCFRICMTDIPKNSIRFKKPENYNPLDYELLLRVFEAGWTDIYSYIGKFDMLPNRKTDTNNRGPVSSDNIGLNYDYPEGSYERRKEIIEEHKTYQMGLYWFVANDPRVPDEVKKEMQKWGLAKDEFTDNENWPHQIYVREARRMIGEYVTTENDILLKREVPRPIGMGSYSMDSHNVQRYTKPDGNVQNEGDIGIKIKAPYSISYGSIIPKKEECSNLLVPVCVSSSHIAFGSIRMEPVFMILGQSAAVAAVIAIDSDCAVQDVPYSELRKKLESKKQVLDLNNLLNQN
ncbi:FAD-dependent oxidoreductase [Maribellus maritimus]|uniref:FAD-dependent oxidoreductase n=1 Tax=Maribellus maritimus TaxID=2870838 RepID=UPI001EEC50D9|nr:FAD-dependent oxidoreductase [Maribellus maritimus]MCG6190712.1 FAD-dependent oxidoreductase [Maribellus maritimus]